MAERVDHVAKFDGSAGRLQWAYQPSSHKMRTLVNARPDEQLWEDLFRVWKRRFINGKNDWETNTVLRALAVAYHVASIPYKNSFWYHDFGINISLWVSAFEVLTHPRKGNSNFETVISLLNKTQFSTPSLKRKRTVTYKGKKISTHYAGWLYKKLYNVRNDFLHGNRVTFNRLVLDTQKSKVLLNKVAPLVFAVALTRAADPYRNRPIPTHLPLKKILRRLTKRGFRTHPYESALERVLSGKDDSDVD